MRTMSDKYDQVLTGAKAHRAGFARNDEGSLTIFSLFMFLLIMLITGMAVDMMRHENERVAIQQTIDTAVVATSSLSQAASTEAEVIALVKEHVAKAGYDPDMVTVDAIFEGPAGGTTTGRSVSATVDFKMDTMFMNMMGIDTLNGKTVGAAREGQQLIEIALVLDVSGSMGENSKLENLKTAAKEFVTLVINANGADRVSISIVPYNQFVYADDDLAARITWANTEMTVPTNEVLMLPGAGNVPHPGAITQYNTHNAASRCAVFTDADFDTRSLVDGGGVVASGMYSENGNGMGTPSGNNFWCGEDYPRVMLYQNSESVLHTHIDSLTANGWTAIDYGMNFGVGILDPSFEPIITDMVANNLLPAQMASHPVPYTNNDVLKYVVLMTDGKNTEHNDLKTEFKSGPTPVWFSPSAAAAAGNDYAGYFVEMPDRPATERWYFPNDPGTTSDDVFDNENMVVPLDAVQLDYHALYSRFRLDAAAEYFFANSDPVAYAVHLESNSEEDIGGYGTADTRTEAICDTAVINDRIEVFTVAFEAPTAAQTLLAGCASKTGNYFDVNGKEISAAFSSIAAQISQLRLTQ